MEDNLLVRDAVETDETAVRCIYNACQAQGTWAEGNRKYTEESIHSFFMERKEKKEPLLVAQLDGRVAGFALLWEFREWKTEEKTMEYGIYVDLDCRRHGVASLLLEVVKERAAGCGAVSLMACIDIQNLPSLWFHENRGFTSVGSFTKWKKDGNPETVALYELELTQTGRA